MRTRKLFFGAVVTTILASTPALALQNIVHPYQSVRSAGMGGVKITTGLYDENFFGNPARSTANPKWKVGLLDPMMEATGGTFGNVGKLTGGESGELPQKLATTAGENTHGRFQMTFPSVFLPNFDSAKKLSIDFAMITSIQFDVDLRNSFIIEPIVVADVGPAFTVAHKFMEKDELSVGATAHIAYRMASKSITLIDLIQGSGLSPNQIGGQGGHLDFDIGGTYAIPYKPWELFDLTAGLSINNILGGKYKNLGLKVGDATATLEEIGKTQPRTLNFGVSATKAELWKFTDAVFAFEFQDIGNNNNGSWFRTVHFGGEVKWSVLRPRLGFNQGYITAGLGVDIKAVTIDFATYGEEMGLNVGDLQDRRFAFRFAFQI